MTLQIREKKSDFWLGREAPIVVSDGDHKIMMMLGSQGKGIHWDAHAMDRVTTEGGGAYVDKVHVLGMFANGSTYSIRGSPAVAFSNARDNISPYALAVWLIYRDRTNENNPRFWDKWTIQYAWSQGQGAWSDPPTRLIYVADKTGPSLLQIERPKSPPAVTWASSQSRFYVAWFESNGLRTTWWTGPKEMGHSEPDRWQVPAEFSTIYGSLVGPAMVYHEKTKCLILAFRGVEWSRVREQTVEEDTRIYYCTASTENNDGARVWSVPMAIPAIYTRERPQLAILNDNVYLFWKDQNIESSKTWYCHADSWTTTQSKNYVIYNWQKWQELPIKSRYAPTAAHGPGGETFVTWRGDFELKKETGDKPMQDERNCITTATFVS